MNKNKLAGFSFIELILIVAIVAVLVTIATPAFRDMLVEKQNLSMANLFHSHLMLARSEAIKRGVPVTVCIANADKTHCALNGNNYASGWLVMIGADPFKFGESGNANISLTGAPGFQNRMVFLPSGRVQGFALNTRFYVNVDTVTVRNIVVSSIGRASVCKVEEESLEC
jgi:type IV fimbrial biogenesis protein FimT